jgi:DNA-binding GntR family transcriptional regulator
MPSAKVPMETASDVPHHRSLASTAYQTLYGKIISLHYQPGQHLEEAALVDELGIGRTPVREALQRLAADLLVESQPGKGFVVRPITLQNTKAAFAALQILELGVADLAVRQENRLLLETMREANLRVAEAVNEMNIYRLVEANSAFHDAFARCSDNIYLVQSLQRVRCETNRLAYLSFGNEIDPQRNLKEHYASVIDQHNGMIEALRDRDAERLKALIVEHLGIFKRRIIQYLAEF